MEGPLTELRNQRLPRRKMAQTYGKKKASGTGTAHKDLFGSDEREIDVGLANLSLNPQTSKSPKSSPKTPKKPTRSSTKAKKPTESALEEHHLISPDDSVAIKPLSSLSEGTVDLFSSFGNKLAKSFNVEKIGEGSFAEVFKVVPKTNTTSSQSSSSSSSSASKIPTGGAIIKIIPLKLPSSDSSIDDRLSPVDSVAREIRVFRTLDSIHGFTRFRGVRLVTGLWPKIFLDAFRAFRRANRKRAINGAPDEDFDEKQIYALIEMDDAGSEISLIKRPSVFQIHDIFWMTVILLANAEEQVEFEHRDLHLSNVCVKPYITAPDKTEGVESESSAGLRLCKANEAPPLDINPSLLASMTEDDVPTTKLGLSNLKITIIDYTVTRCQLTAPDMSNPASEIAYDPMLFVSDVGTSGATFEETIQFGTYRKCKAAVELAQRETNADTEEDNKWKRFVPRTNVVWLAYLLRALARRSKGRTRKYYVVRGSSKVAKAVQEEMWDVLALVEDVVCGVDLAAEEDSGSDGVGGGGEEEEEFSEEELRRTPGSARELLARAVEEGWLSREEVDVFSRRLESEA